MHAYRETGADTGRHGQTRARDLLDVGEREADTGALQTAVKLFARNAAVAVNVEVVEKLPHRRGLRGRHVPLVHLLNRQAVFGLASAAATYTWRCRRAEKGQRAHSCTKGEETEAETAPAKKAHTKR